MQQRRLPRSGMWLLAVMVAALLYVLSFGPACWITINLHGDGRWIGIIYRPILIAVTRIEPLQRQARWYVSLGVRPTVFVSFGGEGIGWMQD